MGPEEQMTVREWRLRNRVAELEDQVAELKAALARCEGRASAVSTSRRS